MEVMRRLCCPCPLAALKSPNVVGVDGYGTKPVGLNHTKKKARALTSTQTHIQNHSSISADYSDSINQIGVGHVLICGRGGVGHSALFCIPELKDAQYSLVGLLTPCALL